MKLSSSEQEGLTRLLTRIYGEILEIEQRYQLLVGVDDFRPRIDYFHDAIRAFTSKDGSARNPGGRLTVELLAYDLSCLRYIQSMPLSSFKPHGETMSPKNDLVVLDRNLVAKAPRPNREVREQLTHLYQHYAVLFAALLKVFADHDYRDRIADLNGEVEAIHAIAEQIGKGSAASLQHLDDDELRALVQKFLHEQLHKKKDALKKMQQHLKQQAARRDREIAAIESAHMSYVLAQLAVFEDSKDLLKKMAGQGMNLVGKFVESAIAETRRDMGR